MCWTLFIGCQTFPGLKINCQPSLSSLLFSLLSDGCFLSITKTYNFVYILLNRLRNHVDFKCLLLGGGKQVKCVKTICSTILVIDRKINRLLYRNYVNMISILTSSWCMEVNR